MLAEAPRPPIMEHKGAIAYYLACTVCCIVKPRGMVQHSSCSLYCLEDAIKSATEDKSECPRCQQQTTIDGNLTAFHTLPPVIESMISEILYRCDYCGIEMKHDEALHHKLKICEKRGARFKPPPHVPDRIHGTHRLYEVVSNPRAKVQDLSEAQSRLTHIHLNGAPFCRKTFSQFDTAKQVKESVAKLADIDPAKIKLAKFVHIEIPDAEKIGGYACSRGMNYLHMFTRESVGNDELNETALLHLSDWVASPVIPKQEPTKRPVSEVD